MRLFIAYAHHVLQVYLFLRVVSVDRWFVAAFGALANNEPNQRYQIDLLRPQGDVRRPWAGKQIDITQRTGATSEVIEGEITEAVMTDHCWRGGGRQRMVRL